MIFINAGISILDMSLIPGLPFCIFAGYSVLTYASDSLTYWLPDRIKVGFGKLFHDWVWQVLLKIDKKYTRLYRFLLFIPFQLKVRIFEACG